MREWSEVQRRLGLIAAVVGLLGLVWLIWPRDQPARTDEQSQPEAAPRETRAAIDRREPARQRTIEVVVVDREDRPIADARVCLAIPTRSAAAQRCVRTNRQGIADGLAPPRDDRWRIGVSAPGFRPVTIPRLGQPEPSGAQVRVTLSAGGARLRGRIEDATGGEIEGAFVSVEDASGSTFAATISQASGEFELWAPTGQVLINAMAEGYAAKQDRLVLPSGPVVLRLLPESAIAGRVLDAESGQAIANAIVTARRSDDDSRSRADDQRFTTRSDARGRYQLVGMPAGVFQVTSEGPGGYGTSEGAVALGFAEHREDVDIRIHRGTSLSIEVVRIEQGDGCPGARVELVEEHTGFALTTTTDSLGQAQLSLPVAGLYQVEIACAGHRSPEEQPTVSVSGRPDDRQRLRVEVERGSSVRGQVISERDGAPIADATIALISIGENDPAASALTDDEGRFELSGLEPGNYVALASAPGWFPLDVPVETELPSAGPLTIPLRASGALLGRVVEPGGAPVLDARVLVRRHANNGRFRGETIVDREGRFQFELPPGDYSIDVIGSGGQSLVAPELDQVTTATAKIDAGERSEVELVVAARDGAITGQVVRSDGEPLASAFVCAEPSTPPRGALTHQRCAARSTDVDGSFELRELQAGRYTLTARARGGGEARSTNVEPGDDVELVVQGTGGLVGSAHYADGGAPPDLLIVEVVRNDAEVRRRELFLRSKGRWSVAGLPAGDYTIRVRASAGSGVAEARVQADDTTEVGDVTLDDRTLLSGRVVRLETGEPLAGFRVVATALDAQLRSRYVRDDNANVSDAHGRFVVADPPTGRVTLHVIPQSLDARPLDLTEAHVTVTVNPGDPLEVGDIAIPTRRVPTGQARASFGFGLVRWDHVGDQAEQPARVETITPGGPAARAGLAVGDVVTTIDGFDVIGRRYVLQYRLLAPVGTVITLDTERVAGLVIRGE